MRFAAFQEIDSEVVDFGIGNSIFENLMCLLKQCDPVIIPSNEGGEKWFLDVVTEKATGISIMLCLITLSYGSIETPSLYLHLEIGE